MDNIIIRSMKEEDSSEVLDMMKVFYASPALLSDRFRGCYEKGYCRLSWR